MQDKQFSNSRNEIIRQVIEVFEKQIPFNGLLELKVEHLGLDGARVRLPGRTALIGNFIHGTLHGGVIASVLDVTGGLTAFVSLLEKMDKIADEAKMARLAKFGTIDLRIDFLRPGKGKQFFGTGRVLHSGNRVVVTRMELHNEKDALIAVGAGTYSSV